MSKIKLSVITLLLINFFVFSQITQADGVIKRIKLAKGKHSATLSNAVIRGDEDTYIAGAKAKQKNDG